jgi:lantibiotic modifying enzyme
MNGKSIMLTNSSFDQVLENIDQLSAEEQETLIEVIHRRLTDRKRKEIIQEIKEAEREFDQGKAVPVTPDELMKNCLADI